MYNIYMYTSVDKLLHSHTRTINERTTYKRTRMQFIKIIKTQKVKWIINQFSNQQQLN